MKKTIFKMLPFLMATLALMSACGQASISLDTEALIVMCEDQRQGAPLQDLAQKLAQNDRLISSRLALSAGRIGDFKLWQILVERFGTDPEVSDNLAMATLFPGHGFSKEELFTKLSGLPYTPQLCQALLNLGSQQALDFVIKKNFFLPTVAENLWRCATIVTDVQLQDFYQRFPRQTAYSLFRLRKKGIVKANDLLSASGFIRSVGAIVCDKPDTFLTDPDWRVRVGALRSIQDLKQLELLLGDTNPLVIAEAFAALGRLGGQLTSVQLDTLTPMAAAFYLQNQKELPSVSLIYQKRGEYTRLAAPFMPAENKAEILASALPLTVKLEYLKNIAPNEALIMAHNLFNEQNSSEALEFLLGNDKKENLTEVIVKARSQPAFISLLIENGLAEAQKPQRNEAWYREKLQKIRVYKGFTLDTDLGEISCRFLHNDAPLTVLNFIELAETGYYNKTVFHRVVPAFVCQGGDPTASGSGGPGYAIRCEYNGQQYNDIGVVGMALSGKDTGGSQFFLTHMPTPHLDYNYTIFARMEKGASTLALLKQFQALKEIRLW